MKKSSALFLAFLLLAMTLLAACGGSKPQPATDTNKPAETAPAPAGDGSLDRVKKAGKLLVGMDTTYPPMEFIDTDGKTTIGFDVDLTNALAAKLGVQAEYMTVEFSGIIAGLTGKRYDIIVSSLNITPERQQQADFIEYVKMSQVFVSKKGVDVKNEKDLSGKVVLAQADTTSMDWVESVRKESVKDIKDFITFPGATDTFLALKNDRGDVIVVDEPVGLYYAKLDPATFTITGRAIDPEPVGIAIRKEDKELKAALEKALADITADGTVKQISEKWFGTELGK